MLFSQEEKTEPYLSIFFFNGEKEGEQKYESGKRKWKRKEEKVTVETRKKDSIDGAGQREESGRE